MHNVVSVDGFIADADDQVGPLFDWYTNGDIELVEGGTLKVSRTSAGYIQPVVVSHRPKPDGWQPEGRGPDPHPHRRASYHFVDGVAPAIAKAKELAGDGTVTVAAGDVGGQAFALGLVDEVAMDVVPVVFGSGKRYFGSVDAQHLLEDPHIVVQGCRVQHLRYRVRR
jgi:dihydrofolate reductase